MMRLKKRLYSYMMPKDVVVNVLFLRRYLMLNLFAFYYILKAVKVDVVQPFASGIPILSEEKRLRLHLVLNSGPDNKDFTVCQVY
jgi:hypothetical protein